jgi:hypothetical protein
MNKIPFRPFVVILFLLIHYSIAAQQKARVKETNVDSGWANNSVNAVVFRKNSLVSFKGTQFIAYYDKEGYMVIGKRKTGVKWKLKRTHWRGNMKDAHNCISIMVDGEGYLHVSWDHHNTTLNYCRSTTPGSLELTDKMPMTNSNEQSVSYPEFYRLMNGDLLFFYRDGGSGRGNLVINRYRTQEKKWEQLHSNLIDGEKQRNAYWQACVDSKGTIHVSWVWRESADVASNHDMCYARSTDGGRTWTNSEGKIYMLPITAASAEFAWRIPQNSELINQTSMFADDVGAPFIATYWREGDDSIPQYHLIYKKNNRWESQVLRFHKTPFTLAGAGTKRIPISRPQIIAWKNNVAILFRDSDRMNKVSMAISRDISRRKWKITDLTNEELGSWEPTYDTELWKEKKVLNVFVQKVEQGDAETNILTRPQMVRVLEWKAEY